MMAASRSLTAVFWDGSRTTLCAVDENFDLNQWAAERQAHFAKIGIQSLLVGENEFCVQEKKK